MIETPSNTEMTGIHAPEKADAAGAAARMGDQEGGPEDTYFLLKDSVHEFTLGLSDILDCLKYAEAKGLVPPVPVPWWISLAGMYPGHESWTDIPGRKTR